jgi:hypothetical protein
MVSVQMSAGGETHCPLQEEGQLSFASAMLLLAEALSFKVSALTPNEAASDLVKRSGSVPSVRVAVF